MTLTIKNPATPETPVEFKRAVIAAPTNLVLSVDGLPKTGKTKLMASMPAPLCIHNFNFGLKGVIDSELKAGKEIYVEDYEIVLSNKLPGTSFNEMGDAAKRAWDRFARAFLESLRQMRSVGVDMGGEAWDTIRLARLGKLTQVLPVQYTAVNAEFRQLIQEAIRSKANVMFLHKLKPEYKDDKKTDRFERSGFGDIGFDMEAIVRTTRDYSKAGVDQFAGKIEECRANFEASGRVFTGRDLSFASIATAIYPETALDDWR